MQALGAFGSIIQSRGDDWYRLHVPTAVRSLQLVTRDTPLEESLSPILAKYLASAV